MGIAGRSEVLCALIASVLVLGSGGCGDPGDRTSHEPLGQTSQALLTVPSTDPDDVRDTILLAAPGQTVFFPGGDYVLDKTGFKFKSGVAFLGDTEEETVILSAASSTRRLDHVGSAGAVKNVTIENITFQNVGLRFQGEAGRFSDSSNIYLKNVTFKGGKGDVWAGDGYVSVKYSDGVVIDGCTFLRSDKFQGGRGIRSYHAHNTIIKDSFIGTTKHLPDGAPDGWFRVGINVLNNWDGGDDDPRSKNVKIHNTVLRRIHNPDCSEIPIDPETGEPTDSCLSHGIYAAYYDGLELTQSRIDGWAADHSENSLKLKNTENTFVFGNHFMRAGFHFITDTGQHPRYTYNAHVRDNRFHIPECDDPRACGISAGRDSGVPPPTRDFEFEQNVYWTDNTFSDLGGVSLNSSIFGPAFCVENNDGTVDFGSATGVRTSGCSPDDSWDRPLAGVFSGDFNEDGKQDTATRVEVDENVWTWRVHASDGDHYDMLDFGDGASVNQDTEKYGVHVGDFTGNGKDDIMYFGRCGSTPCWRVHASQGTSFETKTTFGDGVFLSDETFRFGFHVGDFNGDRKDDLVYRGKCGSPGAPCWRVHKSTGTTFTTHNFGNDANWYANESEIYGLFIGNFDGDAAGRDDIAYFGKCGSSRCIRVHLSTGSAFVYQSTWDQGAGVLRDGPEITEHFGMQVGDMNKDGKADIGYRGRCGTDNKQWRYHRTKPAGNGFEIVCSDSYLFE